MKLVGSRESINSKGTLPNRWPAYLLLSKAYPDGPARLCAEPIIEDPQERAATAVRVKVVFNPVRGLGSQIIEWLPGVSPEADQEVSISDALQEILRSNE